MWRDTECAFCEAKLGFLETAVKVDDEMFCRDCFRLAHPRWFLKFGGEYEMYGHYTIETREVADVEE